MSHPQPLLPAFVNTLHTCTEAGWGRRGGTAGVATGGCTHGRRYPRDAPADFAHLERGRRQRARLVCAAGVVRRIGSACRARGVLHGARGLPRRRRVARVRHALQGALATPPGPANLRSHRCSERGGLPTSKGAQTQPPRPWNRRCAVAVALALPAYRCLAPLLGWLPLFRHLFFPLSPPSLPTLLARLSTFRFSPVFPCGIIFGCEHSRTFQPDMARRVRHF